LHVRLRSARLLEPIAIQCTGVYLPRAAGARLGGGCSRGAAGEGPGWSATAVDDPETSVVLWAATAQVPQHGSIGFLTKYPLSLHRLSPDGLTPLSALAISACRDVRRVDAPRQPGALCREARLRSVLSEAQPFTEPRAVIKCGMSLGLALQ
jgi:hypothetical protein